MIIALTNAPQLLLGQRCWTFGPERDDANKKHPDLIPYSALPDSEKEYDRIMAFDTIRLVEKLGFKIVKK